MLRPVARLCLRSGLSIQDLVEAAKVVFVNVARDEHLKNKEKLNVSRLSVATGLHRRDVARILSEDGGEFEPVNLLSRLVGLWENGEQYKTRAGKPKVLSFEGEGNEFYSMVKQVTKDVHPSSILHQVERLSLVERTAHGLRLLSGSQDVRKDLERGYHVLSQDIEDLSIAVEENILGSRELPNLHARTEFDNLFEDSLPEVREWLLKEGSLFHQRARTFLANHDADLQPHVRKAAGKKVILTCFSRLFES